MYLNIISVIEYFQELQYFFPDSKSKIKSPKNTATLQNCTCCIIKPHAIQEKFLGKLNILLKYILY